MDDICCSCHEMTEQPAGLLLSAFLPSVQLVFICFLAVTSFSKETSFLSLLLRESVHPFCVCLCVCGCPATTASSTFRLNRTEKRTLCGVLCVLCSLLITYSYTLTLSHSHTLALSFTHSLFYHSLTQLSLFTQSVKSEQTLFQKD